VERKIARDQRRTLPAVSFQQRYPARLDGLAVYGQAQEVDAASHRFSTPVRPFHSAVLGPLEAWPFMTVVTRRPATVVHLEHSATGVASENSIRVLDRNGLGLTSSAPRAAIEFQRGSDSQRVDRMSPSNDAR